MGRDPIESLSLRGGRSAAGSNFDDDIALLVQRVVAVILPQSILAADVKTCKFFLTLDCDGFINGCMALRKASIQEVVILRFNNHGSTNNEIQVKMQFTKFCCIFLYGTLSIGTYCYSIQLSSYYGARRIVARRNWFGCTYRRKQELAMNQTKIRNPKNHSLVRGTYGLTTLNSQPHR
jgi:hypothetical protein